MTQAAIAHDRSPGERLGAMAGIGAALILIGIIVVIPTGPSADASGEEIKAALLAQGNAMLVGHYLEGLMLMLFLWFAASLHDVLRRAEAGAETLATTMLGGAIATVAVILVAHAIQAALALRIAPDGDPALLQALFALAAMVDAFFAIPLAVFLAATGAVVVRSGAISRWLGWAAGVIALLLVVGLAGTLADTGPLVGVGIVGFLLFVLWLLAASSMLLRRGEARRPIVREAPAL
jgi:hypothetical protein